MRRGFLRSRILVRSLRRVPPTAALLQRRTTKRLYFGPCPALGLVDRRNIEQSEEKRKRALYPRPEVRGFTARAVRVQKYKCGRERAAIESRVVAGRFVRVGLYLEILGAPAQPEHAR